MHDSSKVRADAPEYNVESSVSKAPIVLETTICTVAQYDMVDASQWLMQLIDHEQMDQRVNNAKLIESETLTAIESCCIC